MPTLSTSGVCEFCKETFPKAAMTRHLKTCGAPKPAAVRGVAAVPKRYFHVVVEGRHAPQYWLHLAVATQAPLLENLL